MISGPIVNTRGGQEYDFSAASGEIPIFVKFNTILPLAEPVQFVSDRTEFKIRIAVYGDNPAAFSLYEDDGESFDFEKGKFNTIVLSWDGNKGNVTRRGQFDLNRYNIEAWDKINVQ